MGRPALRFFTFLAPKLFPVYEFITHSVGKRLGLPTELVVGSRYRQLLTEADISFVCGLAYVRLRHLRGPVVEPLAVPVLQGPRYGGRPVYFSDIIVHRHSPFRSFADLRGGTWAYNEPHSHSGCGVVRYHLARLGEVNGYFGKVIRAGWHERSIRLVCSGKVDGAAIDSHVLDVVQRDQPELAARWRVIEVLGPSTIQPVVAARRLPKALKEELRAILLELGHDPRARAYLHRGFVERFVSSSDGSYEDIRQMLAVAEGNSCPLCFAGVEPR
jgi:phosphonate transport system substrate-binding protein